MFVKIYHTSVVYILLEYDGEPFDGKLITVKEPERSCYDLTALQQLALPQVDFYKNSHEVNPSCVTETSATTREVVRNSSD